MTQENTLMRRPRIDSLLEKALEKPVVTVVAGPGCGKTCAVNAYLHSGTTRTLWVQLSEADNRPARFWENFARAVGLRSGLADRIRRLDMPSNRAELRMLAGILADEIKPRFRYALVFDDLHLIRDSAVLWFIRALAYGMLSGHMERISAGASIVLISREDCGFGGEGLAAEGNMAFIGGDDLNFTRGEAMELFRFMGAPVTPALRAGFNAIYDDTEGWPFLLGIAGRLLKTRPDSMKYIRSALRHNISMVIENELFLQNSPEMNKFLVKLSLVSCLFADFIARLDRGEDFLRELAQHSSLIRYDACMNMYHIHHLVQDYLSEQQCLLMEEEKRAVYKAAAEWCMEHELLMDAAGHYARAGDYRAVVGIVYRLPQIIPFGKAAMLFDILEGAPAGLREELPWIHYRARLLLCLGKTEQAMEEMRGKIRLLEQQGDSPDNRRILGGAWYMLGSAHMLLCSDDGDYSFAAYFQTADAYYKDTGFVPLGSMRMATLAPYTIRVGRKDRGEPEKYIKALAEAVPYVSRIMHGCMYGLDDLARAELAYYRADIAGCRRFSMQALFKAREKEQHEIENRALFYLMKAGLASGKYEHSKEAMRQMDEQLDQRDFLNRYIRHDIQTGWFYGSIGQKEQIADWLKSDFSVSHPETVLSNYEDIARCRYYLLEQDYSAMLAMLSSRSGSFDIARYLFGQAGLEAHRAVCLYNLKDAKGAFDALRRAYALASPNGLDMTFIELGNHMRTLAAAAQKGPAAGIPTGWLETIQTKAATYAKRVGQVRSQYRQEAGLDGSAQLTQKEMDLLVDLSHGLSRTEIAAARHISVNTVKMMLQYIYEKLGAENSMDAVRLAFTKGLL